MSFAWIQQGDKHFNVVVDEAITACERQGVPGIHQQPTNFLIICREDAENGRIQPFISVGASIDDPDKLEASVEELAQEYFSLPTFGLQGESFYFAVVEHVPGSQRYSRAIAGVVKKAPTRRSLFRWPWG